MIKVYFILPELLIMDFLKELNNKYTNGEDEDDDYLDENDRLRGIRHVISSTIDDIDPDIAVDENLMKISVERIMRGRPDLPLQLIMRPTGVLYYYFRLFGITTPLLDMAMVEEYDDSLDELTLFRNNSLFSDDFITIRTGVKNILTLAAKNESFSLCGWQWWRLLFLSQSLLCQEQLYFYFSYLLMDIGYLDVRSTDFLLDILQHFVRRQEEATMIVRALKAYKSNPLSLSQLCRRAIRNCMREGHVLEDCYKLTVPASIQDYVSLRSLNAPIRKWIIKEEKPSFVNYKQYDAKKEVLERYQLKN